MIEDDPVDELLRGLEEEMLNANVRKDAVRMNLLLDDEFREFGSSGRTYTKRQIVDALVTESPVRLSLRDFRAVRFAEDAVLVTYRSVRDEEWEALRSSVWVRREGVWRLLFHQGTRVPPDASA